MALARASSRGRRPLGRGSALLLQALVILVLLAGWEYVPKLPNLSKISPIFDAYFISAPSRVFQTLVEMFSGTSISGPIWPYLRETVQNALIGTCIGMVGGMVVGLLMSNDARLNQILRPFVVSLNAVPRIAIIPIMVILLGASGATAIASASITSFFAVFFNAYTGGRATPGQVLENARVLGATPTQVMRHVRLPYVLAWSFASLPNALSLGLLSVVTAEILTGYAGTGRLLIFAIGSASSSLTIAVVIVLSTMGVALVAISDLLRRRWLHWWIGGRASA